MLGDIRIRGNFGPVAALHRFKADEAYLIGVGKGPVEAYLDVEGIVALAGLVVWSRRRA